MLAAEYGRLRIAKQRLDAAFRAEHCHVVGNRLFCSFAIPARTEQRERKYRGDQDDTGNYLVNCDERRGRIRYAYFRSFFYACPHNSQPFFRG